jgi:protein SCO1/2
LTRVLLLLILVIAAGCRQPAAPREYPLQGQIVGIDRESGQLTVKHEDVPGLMPAMIMSFEVADRGEIDRRALGELITATLVLGDSSSHLKDIKVTGRASVDQAVARQVATPMLEAGDPVADAEFTDQDGRARRLSEWRGRRLLVTFIYTRCPLPDFCPRLERNLRDVQSRVASDPALKDQVRLLAVTFDPRHDTPAVLKKRAAELGADPSIWTYLTGDLESIERFAARFGVTIIRNPADDKDITHNLRTAIIAADGTLVEILSGSSWNAEEALTAVRQASAKTN